MRFSVLIPVYNVEKYLDQCLRSVLTQDYADFEVILVNDGSTDGSPEICRRYAEEDSRIRFFDKENDGLLLTRRYSIRRTSGEYLVFLDSDDFWEQGILSRLNREIESSHPDMICYRFRVVTDTGEPVYEDKGVFPDGTFFDTASKETFLKEFVGSSRLNNIWLKCVKSDIVDRDTDYSRFKDKKGEDILQSIAMIRNAGSIVCLDDVLVNYRMSPSGRGRNFKLKYIDDYDTVKNHVYSNLREMGVSESVIDVFRVRYIESIVGFLGSIVSYAGNYQPFAEICRHIGSFPLFMDFAEIVSPDAVSRHARCDYKNLVKQRYHRLYCEYMVRNALRKIIPSRKQRGNI